MRIIASIILVLLISKANGQQKNYSSDVTSADAVVGALYEVISGDAGADRDWNRFRNLFSPDARLIPTRKNEKGELSLKALSPEEYVTMFTTRMKGGFFENELHKVTESYGTVTHVFSTYETRETKDGKVTARGINSIQLFHDGQRYFIVSVLWCAESLGFPVPEKYVK
jgi:hypothetical protein